ncbi:hypothetical protein H7X68_00415 [Candidatus Saccharibacteria bacterium]|nr:hypothetical protein [Candidatus Saccharibacteria bacterium]
MTNSQPSLHHQPPRDAHKPLRRPGWSLIQDVRPARQTPHRIAAMQPESWQQPATTVVSRHLPPAQAHTTSPRQRLILWFQAHTLAVATPLIVFTSIQLSAVPIVGEGLIAAYGLMAVVRRIPSRISFWLATVVLASISIEFLLLPDAGRAADSALFVFMLLCIGLITSMLETRRMAKH